MIDLKLMDIFSSFFPQIKSIFWVVIFFGGSIFIHELGHFIAAKRKKFFVPRFSIGFGPRLFSKTIGETEFCISFFPFGGYVALPQLMEVKELEGKYVIPIDTPPISWRDKIVVSVMGAVFNVIFAFILAIILWKTGMEQPQNLTNNIIGYIKPKITLSNGKKINSPAKEVGLRIGDQIIAIDGIKTDKLSDIIQCIALGKNRDSRGPLSKITILRDGKYHDLIIHPILLEQNQRSKESIRTIGIETFQELFILDVHRDTPAERAGLKKGDKLIAINGENLFSYSQFKEILDHESEFQLTIERNQKLIIVPIFREKLFVTCPVLKITTEEGGLEIFPSFYNKNLIKDPHKDKCVLQLLSLEPRLQKKISQWKIGDFITHIQDKHVQNMINSFSVFQNTIGESLTLRLNHQDYSIVIKNVEFIPSEQYFSIGVELCSTHVLVHDNPFHQIGQSAYFTFLTFKGLLSPSSDVHFKNLIGPPGIIDTLYTFAGYDLRLLLWLVITLNINLAILNLLPIPVLDGGIIALTLLEKILRRKMATQIFVGIQLTFMLLFLGLILYVSFFDVSRILEKQNMEKFYRKQRQLTIDERLLWNGLKSE